MSPLEVDPLARLMKALADETRLRIVALLAHGELCVCHLETALDIPQPTASRNLSILRHAGVVEPRRDGSWIYYRLAPQSTPAAARVLDALVAGFAADPALRTEVESLRKSRGPSACG